MYTLHKGEEPVFEEEVEKTFSEDDIKVMLKNFIIDKASEYPELTEEQLEKGLKNAFKTGLTVMGLIHGAHHIGQMDESAPAPREERVSKPRPFSSTSYGGKQVKNFLGTVGNLSSSNIRGMDSDTGDDHLSSVINRYKSMSDEEVDQHLEKFPSNRAMIETHHAGNIFREHGGNFKGMTASWNKQPEKPQEKQIDNQLDQNNTDQYRDLASD